VIKSCHEPTDVTLKLKRLRIDFRDSENVESSEPLATSLRQAVKIGTYLSVVDPWGGVDWQRPRAFFGGCVVGRRRKAMREFSGVGTNVMNSTGSVKGAAPTTGDTGGIDKTGKTIMYLQKCGERHRRECHHR
jgi:hypothetical protein